MIITTTTTVATFGANNIVCQQGEVLYMMCVINFFVSFWTCNFVVFRLMGYVVLGLAAGRNGRCVSTKFGGVDN
jgi:hypothetical protein